MDCFNFSFCWSNWSNSDRFVRRNISISESTYKVKQTCQMFIGLLKTITSVVFLFRRFLGSPCYRLLNCQRDTQIDSQRAREIDNQITRQLDSQTARQLDSQIARQLDSQIARQLDSQTARQLDIQIARQLDSQTGVQINFTNFPSHKSFGEIFPFLYYSRNYHRNPPPPSIRLNPFPHLPPYTKLFAFLSNHHLRTVKLFFMHTFR